MKTRKYAPRFTHGRKLRFYAPPFTLWAKSTSQTGARWRAHEMQTVNENPLLKIAGMAATKVRWYGMPFPDRKLAAYHAMVLNLPKIKEAEKPEAYAYVVAVNHLRKLRDEELDGPSTAVSQLSQPMKMDQPDWENLSPGERLELMQAKQASEDFWKESRLERMIEDVHEALGRIPSKENTIVRMFYSIGEREYCIAEIADCVGYSIDYVKQLKGQALGRLEVLLSSYDPDLIYANS